MSGPHAEADASEVDVIILTRDGLPPPVRVREALLAQEAVKLAVHLIDGSARPGETHRLETIVRCRNAGGRRGSAPWVMFLDDDVVLGPGCISLLLHELRRRPGYAAIAADYLGDLERLGPLGLATRSGGLPI